MQEIKAVCEKAARIGGQILLDWRGRFRVREKGPADLVTEADLAAQRAISSCVLEAFPEHSFLGEEDTSEVMDRTPSENSSSFCWIVDPLDGTTNYVHGLKGYCTSVALQKNEQIVAGAVYDPEADECYTAAAGQGAYLNGDRIVSSDATLLIDSLTAASFPPQVTRDSEDVVAFLAVLNRCRAVRRLGSAALNLSYVAAGRLDAYWAMNLLPWDMAAGMLLVQEAGGVITSPDGGDVDLQHPRLVAAAGPQLHQELLGVIGRNHDQR